MPAHRATEIRIRDVSIKLHRVGEGTPVLFLHGANGLPQWLPFFDAVADGYEVLVPEHPGFGASDDPPWIRNVGDLAHVLSRFRSRSSGSSASTSSAIRSAAGLPRKSPCATARACRASRSMSAAGIRVPGLPSGDLFIWGPEETVRNVYYDQALAERMLALKPTEEQMDIMLKNRFTATKFGWQPRWFNPDLEKWLHRIKVPSLVVWGVRTRSSRGTMPICG